MKKRMSSIVTVVLALLLLVIGSQAMAGNGTLGDSNIKYYGRWDFSNPSRYLSYWGGAYIKVKFTGTTVKVKVGKPSNYYAQIDNGPWISYNNAEGTINLTRVALHSGTHTLSVAQGKDYDYVFDFRGLILDPGAVTQSPVTGKRLIEYIGDSITAGYTDPQANVSAFGWVLSEKLGAEHTQISYPGINLTSGYKGTAGMETQYFKQQSPAHPQSPDWDFKNYTPNTIVINLGTNDNTNQIADTVFQKTYINFLAKVRGKFPKARIYVLRTFLNLKSQPTQAAVAARNAEGDKYVFFIDTEGWLEMKSADYTDNVHPSVIGNRKVAEKLITIIR